MTTRNFANEEAESPSLAGQAAMMVAAIGVTLTLVLYLALHGAPDGDEAGRPAVPPAAGRAVWAGPALLPASTDPDVAYMFVVRTEGERVALVEWLTTENNVRSLVGDKPRTAWVAVAADDAEEALLAATIADQNAMVAQRLVMVSLRAR